MARLFAISDVHTDYEENLNHLKNISLSDFQNDALILAGDVSHKWERLKETLEVCCERFQLVFFVPGNHDLWVPKEERSSLEKFDAILEMCDELGVAYQPREFGGHWVYPLFSWYDEDFCDPNTPTKRLEHWKDFLVCDWPMEKEALSRFFYDKNLPLKKRDDLPVVTFSHFVPRPEMMPPFPRLRFEALPRVSGSLLIDQQARELNSICHVFGHTHINIDWELDGIRYIQNSLRYPREQKFWPVNDINEFLVRVF